MKKSKDWKLLYGRRCREGVRKMLVFTFSLIAISLQSMATAYSQVGKVSFEVENATLAEIIPIIERSTNYTFLYQDEQVERVKNLTFRFTDEDLRVVLEKCLEGTNLTYRIEDNTIILKAGEPKPEASLPQVQERKLTGKVTDEAGVPLPGVTVVIEGTTVGTATDADGNYVLNCPEQEGLALVFSFVGMEVQRVVVGDRTELNVVMEAEVTEIDEVVVTGIYTRNKESFTGSSKTYSEKELKMMGNTNVLRSLRTLDPSFAIMENNLMGSDPNTLPDINVRGTTSIAGLEQEYGQDPNQPLFILDGFESTLATINNLSMDRVASITILKDAAATAIYGSKAANGVIVVETKAPKPGTLQVNYNGNLNLSFADLTDYNLMNSSEKLEFEKLAGYYGDLDANGDIISEGYAQTYYSRLAEVRRGVDTYWMSEPLRFAVSHSHDLFVEGGDDRMRYGLGFNYNKTQGVMKGSDRDVLNGNLRLIYRYKTLAFTNYMNVDYSFATRENIAFSQFSRANPYYRKTNEYGEAPMILQSYGSGTSMEYMYNPLYDMQQNSFDETKAFGFRNNFEIDWRIISTLRLRGRFSISKTVTRGEVFRSPHLSEFYNRADDESGSYAETNSDVVSYDGDINLTYGQLLKEKHMVNAVVGMQLSSSANESSSYTVYGFTDDRIPNPAYSSGFREGAHPTYSNSKSRSASYYLNGGYAFDERYLLDFNLRADGSSVFGVDNKFSTTWAIGIGWNVHNEAFLENSAVVNYLKLRYSIGNPGNQNFSTHMSSNMYNYISNFTNPFGLGTYISSYGNPHLEWQKTIDQNYGIDVELFDSRLNLTFDYFTKDTDPLLVDITLPASTGTTSIPSNLGSQKTKGYTFSANVVLWRRDNLQWRLNANGSHYNYEYQDIGNSLDRYNQQNQQNEANGTISSTNMKRYYDGGSPSDLWAVRSAGIDPVTGREIFIKKDGTQTFTHDTEDEVVVGCSDPDLEGIIGTSFYWKGLSVSVNFRYRFGGQIFLSTLYEKVENITETEIRYNQDKRALYDRWQKPGDIAKYKSISLSESTPMSSRFIANENTLSGESISITYETSAKWLKRIGASSMTFGGYMNDIFYSSSVTNERGLDYPFARSISFSLGLRF